MIIQRGPGHASLITKAETIISHPRQALPARSALLDRPEPLVRGTQSINKGLPTQRSVRHRKLPEQEV
jgi:hypothetical protein